MPFYTFLKMYITQNNHLCQLLSRFAHSKNTHECKSKGKRKSTLQNSSLADKQEINKTYNCTVNPEQNT